MHMLSAAAVKAHLGRDEEYALLDVREQEEYSREHPLLACCLPLSRLEILAPDLLPCCATPLFLMDSGDSAQECDAPGQPPRAQRAAAILTAMGYARVSVMEGGLRAWKKTGFVTFTGVGALSKAFGELVEEELHTPRLEPAEVKAMLDRDENVAVVDIRPREEYAAMSIPGSINAPGCEVTTRIADLVPDPATLIVVNCAGRTRSIISTQTLRNAGVPNRVAALKGGTMNWRLAGFELEHGANRHSAPPSCAALDLARVRAARVARDYGVEFADLEDLRRWQKETDRHALYIFDIRQPEEFLAGHLPGSHNAPGGQLVQATDEYAAVRQARYLLVDDTEVRAVMTAHWLKQMGLRHVAVLRGGLGGSGAGRLGLVFGAESQRPESLPGLAGPSSHIALTPTQLQAALSGPRAPLCINVGESRRHRQGHIPGALWVVRARLARVRAAWPDALDIVLSADEETLARLAAVDAQTLWPEAQVRFLTGGNASWGAAGLPLEKGMPQAYSAEDDIWYKPYEDVNAKAEAMSGYFSWEASLVQDTRRDGDAGFRLRQLPDAGVVRFS